MRLFDERARIQHDLVPFLQACLHNDEDIIGIVVGPEMDPDSGELALMSNEGDNQASGTPSAEDLGHEDCNVETEVPTAEDLGYGEGRVGR